MSILNKVLKFFNSLDFIEFLTFVITFCAIALYSIYTLVELLYASLLNENYLELLILSIILVLLISGSIYAVLYKKISVILLLFLAYVSWASYNFLY